MKPIRLLILGTSNSVLRGGYTSVFEDHPGIELVNRSIGGAPAVVLAYQLGRRQLPEADFCILDTAVNDANWTVGGIFRVDLVKEVLLTAINEVRQQLRATPIVLILPTRNNVHNDMSGVLQAQREVCEATGTLYVDGPAFVRRHMAESGADLDDCFKDAAHLSLPVAQQLGRLLESFLLRQAKPATPPETVTATAFSTLDLPDIATSDLDRIERTSSLVGTNRFIVLKPGEMVEFEVPEGSRLAALAINASKAYGYLEITHSTGILHKDIRFWERAVNPLNDILMKIVPLLGHVGGGPCRLRLLDRAPEGEVEPTEPGARTEARRDAGLEIASVVFIRNGQSAPRIGGDFQLELKTPGVQSAVLPPPASRLARFHYAEERVPEYGVVDLLREMGRLLIDLERPEEAGYFLAHAQSLRPNSPAIRQLLERTRAAVSLQEQV